jgi:hypothetical protein
LLTLITVVSGTILALSSDGFTKSFCAKLGIYLLFITASLFHFSRTQELNPNDIVHL